MKMKSMTLAVILMGTLVWCVSGVEGVTLPFGPEVAVVDPYDDPAAIAVGLINGDLRPDVAFCTEAGGSVRFHFGVGLSSHVTIVTGLDSPTTVAIGDIDNDGDGDVVVGQYADLAVGSFELLWVENPTNGGGLWTSHNMAAFSAAGLRKVALADVDRDGDLDVVYAGGGTGASTLGYGVAWNDGTPGNGTWSTHWIAVDAVEPYGLAIGDVDGDGDIDVIAADLFLDRVLWYENAGVYAGVWTAHTIDASLDGAVSVATGDFDRDGRLDVVAAAMKADRISWYERSGSGWIEHEALSSLDGAFAVFVIDLDGDGDDDVVAGGRTADSVLWLENDGTEGWPSYTVATSFHGVSDVAAGDFDLDGDPEIIAAAQYGDRVSFWRNEVIHRRFATGSSTAIAATLGEPRGIATADLNGDSLVDVVVSEWTGDAITAYVSVSTIGLAWWTDEVDDSFDGVRDVAIADLNGDGHPDIVGAAINDDEIAWWENDGTVVPSWTKHQVSVSVDGAHAVGAADFDLDGDLDLVTLAYNGDSLKWFENGTGTGLVWIGHSIGSVDGPYDLAIGDLNQDGAPDFVVTAYDGDAVTAYLNDTSTGTFTPVTMAILMDGPRGIDLGDIDGDGDLDAVAVMRFADEIRWWANNGIGTVWLGNSFGTGSFVDGAAVHAADLDADGDIDVVATSQENDEVTVLTNAGSGSSWTRNTRIQYLDSPWDLAVARIDLDGDLDLVLAAGGGADTVSWYSNTGGQFRADVWAVAPATIEDDAKEVVLLVTMTHYGRAGIDADLELSGMRIGFTDGGGLPLLTAEVNDLIERLQVYRDADGNWSLDTAVDLWLMEDNILSLSSGELTLEVPDGAERARIAPGESEAFFIRIRAAADASQQDPREIRISVNETQVAAEDRDYDLALAGEPGDLISTVVISFIGDLIFSDGFEGGSTAEWSMVAP